MATLYSEHPDNFSEIEKYFISDFSTYKIKIEESSLCIFYDACSFRYHSNLAKTEQKHLLKYIKAQCGVIVITKCILMELAGTAHHLVERYVNYLEHIYEYGIPTILFAEESLYDFLAEEYESEKINSIFRYAIRAIKKKTSIIEMVLKKEKSLRPVLSNDPIKSKNISSEFFTLVKSYKESDDNLGEELIGICLYMLLYLTAEDSFKFAILTDDKGAAGTINVALASIPLVETEKKAAIISTPKLIQYMISDGIISQRNQVENLLHCVKNGNLIVFATMQNDLKTQEYAFGDATDLANKMLEKNGISITF